MKKQSLWAQIRQRWTDEMPEFWRKVRRLAVVIGSAALGVWTADSAMNLQLDPVILDACRYILAACAAMGLSAQLTTNRPTDPTIPSTPNRDRNKYREEN